MAFDRQLAQEMQRGGLHEWFLQDKGLKQVERIAERIAHRLEVPWESPGEKRLLMRFRLRGVKRALEVQS
jgi:predicted amidophosphoribosyltransferase